MSTETGRNLIAVRPVSPSDLSRLTPPPVSRITAHSHNLSMSLTLDIANELYPLTAQETFTLAVARSLIPGELETDGMDGDGDGQGEAPRRVKRELWRSGDQGLAADYEYVMYGKVGDSIWIAYES